MCQYQYNKNTYFLSSLTFNLHAQAFFDTYYFHVLGTGIFEGLQHNKEGLQ